MPPPPLPLPGAPWLLLPSQFAQKEVPARVYLVGPDEFLDAVTGPGGLGTAVKA